MIHTCSEGLFLPDVIEMLTFVYLGDEFVVFPSASTDKILFFGEGINGERKILWGFVC